MKSKILFILGLLIISTNIYAGDLIVNGNIDGTGDLTVQGSLGVGTTSPGAWKLNIAGTGYFSSTLRTDGAVQVDGSTVIDDGAGWHRSHGNTGWYNGTYGGGWYMADSTWIRSYGNKNIYHNTGVLRTDGAFQVGPSGNRFIVNTSGNVGIGTTGPTRKLEINGDVAIIKGGVTYVSAYLNSNVLGEDIYGGWIRTYSVLGDNCHGDYNNPYSCPSNIRKTCKDIKREMPGYVPYYRTVTCKRIVVFVEP